MSPIPGSPAGSTWTEMPISRVLYISFRIPSNRAPPQSTHREKCPISGAPLQLSLKVNGPPPPPPQVSQRRERHPFQGPSSTHPLITTHLSFKVPSEVAPFHVSQQGPDGKKCFVSRANGLFIHINIYTYTYVSPQ
jgi:hypothetical protein